MIITPNSWGTDFTEAWSDAARAAAVAARRARKQGEDWKRAARAAYLQFSRPSERRQVVRGRRDRMRPGEGTADLRRRARRFAPEPTGDRMKAWAGGTYLPF